MTQTKPAKPARIEHANLTVADPHASADLMRALFGWHIRWEGPSMLGGHTVHVGSENDYLAFYTNAEVKAARPHFEKGVPLNHVGIVVDNLDAVEEKVVAAGLEPFSHGNYEPGRRFYFFDNNGIEFEVVSYD